MELISFGDKVKFSSRKDVKKNSKIHFVLYGGKKGTKLFENNLCYTRYNRDTDIVDEIEDMKTLKAILHDKDMCILCLREFNFMFGDKHREELDLKTAFELKRKNR